MITLSVSALALVMCSPRGALQHLRRPAAATIIRMSASDEPGEADERPSPIDKVRSAAANVLVDALPEDVTNKAERSQAPAVLSEEVCLMPGMPTVRVEVAPGNARRIFTGIDIVAECDDVTEVVWRVLTDYERLSDAVPNLVENQVVERYSDGGAQLRQVGAAKLAPMITFKATTTLKVKPYPDGLPAEMMAEHLGDTDSDSVREFGAALPLQLEVRLRGPSGCMRRAPDCSRTRSPCCCCRASQVFPRPYCISSLPCRDITMQGVPGKGDFRFYQGVWRIQELPECAPPGSSAMRLTYSVELSPKAWVPVALLEGQIATTLGDNLVAIRDFVNTPKALERYADLG